jgi:predicted exporter
VESVLSFARRNRGSVIAGALISAIAGGYLVTRISFDANILRLLPRHSDSVRAFERFLQDFGSLDHLYLEFDADDGIGEHSEFVDAYVEALRKTPEIESVDSQLFEPGKDWAYLSDRELYLLGAVGANEALARFRPPRVTDEVVHSRELLSMPSVQIKAMVRQDPLGLLTMLRDQVGREKGLLAFDPGQEGYVSSDGRSRLVMVKPKGQPFDSDFCKALFASLNVVEGRVRQQIRHGGGNADAVRIQAAGAYRVSLEAEQLIRREGVFNALGSLALLILVVLGVFRTPWVLLFGFLPLAIAAVLTLGLNGAIHGTLSPATSGFTGMLFGLGIDGVVIIYVRYLEERRSGLSADDAITRVSATASSVVLAQLTTAATFLALLLIDFPTLQDLGSLVGLGIICCLVLTILLLPALLPAHVGSRGTVKTAEWLGRFVTGSSRRIVWVSAVGTIALAGAAVRLRLDTSLERLQAQTNGAALEREVARRFSLPQDVLIVMHEDQDIDALLDMQERFQQSLALRAPSITVSGIRFLLPSAHQQRRVSEVISANGITAAEARQNIQAAAKSAGFRDDTFEPFFERLSTLLDPAERITYDGLMAHGLDSVVSRFITRRDGQYEGVVYLYPPPTTDIGALQAIVRDLDPRLRLTGAPVIDHDLRLQFVPQFIRAIAIGFVAVTVLIYAVFRSVRQTLLALLPTVIGFVWSAGILALARVSLDLFSLFAAVTFIGIAVDYGIYLLFRYEVERSADLAGVIARTGPAIVIACVTALIGFGTLVNSSYGPLHVFGVVSLVTLSCCLVASIVSLPALIVELERWSSAR